MQYNICASYIFYLHIYCILCITCSVLENICFISLCFKKEKKNKVSVIKHNHARKNCNLPPDCRTGLPQRCVEMLHCHAGVFLPISVIRINAINFVIGSPSSLLRPFRRLKICSDNDRARKVCGLIYSDFKRFLCSLEYVS